VYTGGGGGLKNEAAQALGPITRLEKSLEDALYVYNHDVENPRPLRGLGAEKLQIICRGKSGGAI
jgi:hypothetical protein